VDEKTFRLRTKNFALEVFKLIDTLPRSRAGDVIAAQLLRSSTSVGANYRAACRAKSAADMIHKLRIVEEESDESIYWLELLTEAWLLPEVSTQSL
jgi:four helix bundle protein